MPGLSARVRYIHMEIIHAALKDILRWNRVVRNVADAATPPSMSSAKALRTKASTAEQLKALLQFAAENRRGSSSPRAGAGEVRLSG